VYGDAARAHAPLQAVPLASPLRALGACMQLLAAFDAACEAQPALGDALAAARRALTELPPASPLAPLDAPLGALQERLASPRFLDAWLLHACGSGSDSLPRCRLLLSRMAEVAGDTLSPALARIAASAERPGDRDAVAQSLCLAVLHARLAGPAGADAALLAACLAAPPSLPLHAHASLRPLSFLAAHLPPGAPGARTRAEGEADAAAAAAAWLAGGALERDAPRLHAQLVAWALSPPRAGGDELGAAAELRRGLRALQLAASHRALLLAALDAHAAADAPLPPSRLRLLCGLAEALQLLGGGGGAAAGAQPRPLALRLARVRLARLLAPARDALQPGLPPWAARGEGARLDGLAALGLAQELLGSGGLSSPRAALLALCLDVLCDPRVLPPDAAAEVAEAWALAEGAEGARAALPAAADCSFLLFHLPLAPAALADALQSGPPERLPPLVAAWGDGHALLLRAAAASAQLRRFDAHLRALLRCALVAPLAQRCEEALRLHLHAARLEGAVRCAPPLDGEPPAGQLARLLRLPPLRLFDGAPPLRLRREVQRALGAAFHAHAGLAPHNWRSYCEMACLARELLGLRLRAPPLPPGTLEQGLDVLEVVRNMHLFASRFAYALYANTFVERPSAAPDRRHLHCVGVRHVANSMRTHGSGIANSAVNVVFQFLTAKLAVVSQFLFDDTIRSRLLREGRWMAASAREWRAQHSGAAPATASAPEYPFTRAAALLADIARLGGGPEGGSFLDAFRGVLGEAGAALGFVRLVRLGALRHGDDAAGSLPRDTPPPRLREAAVRGELGEGMVAAAGALDAALRSLAGSGRGADYFAALVSVFQEELRSDVNAHLREFWLLLPALCASHCEALLAAKERLGKRGREAASAGFVDDGFALGAAYLLRVLGQDAAFDSLRWHEAAERHYERLAAEAAAAAAAAKSRAASGAADDAAVAADVRAVKAKALLGEARLLHWTIHGARTLFA